MDRRPEHRVRNRSWCHPAAMRPGRTGFVVVCSVLLMIGVVAAVAFSGGRGVRADLRREAFVVRAADKIAHLRRSGVSLDRQDVAGALNQVCSDMQLAMVATPGDQPPSASAAAVCGLAAESAGQFVILSLRSGKGYSISSEGVVTGFVIDPVKIPSLLRAGSGVWVTAR